MIHLSVFCPLERVAAYLVEIGRRAKATSLTLDATGLDLSHTCYMVPITDNINFNLGLSVAERRKLLSLPTWDCSVRFLFENGDTATRRVHVVQSLLTDAPSVKFIERTIDGVKKKIINGELADGSLCCYPEALDTIFPTQEMSIVDRVNVVGSDVRPYYNYVQVSKDDESIVIYGPDCRSELMTVAKIKLGSKEFNIIENGHVESVNSETTPVEMGAKKSSRIITYLHLGDQVSEFVFGQINNFLDGSAIPGSDLLKLIKVISFIELANSRNTEPFSTNEIDYRSDSRELHVYFSKREHGYTIFDDKFIKFYQRYIEANEEISSIFEQVDATSTSIIVYEKKDGVLGKSAPLVGEKRVMSCMALSLAYILSSPYDCSLVDMISNITAMLNAGVIYINNDGVLEGNTRAAIEKPLSFKSRFGLLPSRISFTRKDYTKLSELSDGLYVLGLDLDTSKMGLEHYCVVRVNNHHALLEYDPWSVTRKPYGYDLTYEIVGESTFISFHGDMMVLGVTSDLQDLGFGGGDELV